MRLLPAALALSLAALPAVAQDRPNTILVLDGSGSMWGQIDGVAKITIAQEVVSDLLETLPADQRLGLMAYGHRERGNCTDIEMLVEPGEDTRGAIASAVAGISPLGKTPTTDSIVAAAERLRYTEDSATVILVSDGVETCNPDPCAAARALEAAAIDFTAHVIGVDVANDPEAVAQMTCLAEETGGLFLSAANASELGEALTQVVQAEPEPVEAAVTFIAADETSAAVLDEPIQWTVTDAAGAVVFETQGNPAETTLPEGTYPVTAYRLVTEQEGTATLQIGDPGDETVRISFATPLPSATLDAPDTAPAGSVLSVGFAGPNDSGDNIAIGEVEGDLQRYAFYTYTDRGNPVQLQMPIEPGEYLLRYDWRDREVIATKPITVTPIEIGLEAPDSVPIGADITVTWTGPDAGLDNVQIGPVGEAGQSSYVYTERGNPVTLVAPGTPGQYELRYKFLDRTVVFTRPIEVTPLEVTLDFPQSVPAGSDFQVTWSGPDAAGDNVQIGPVGETRYSTYSYTDRGNPVTLTAPNEPGTYEVRYKFRDREVIATREITVSEVTGGLVAPETAVAGSTISVGWDGPDYDRDYISVAEVGSGTSYENYTYTSAGNPLQLLLPVEPGDYEIRYQLAQGNEVFQTVPITLTPFEVALEAPQTATAGAQVQVGWTGPDYDRDYISVAAVGAGTSYENYTYTRDGNPLSLTMPVEPGEYEIRYQTGQDNVVVARVPVTVEDTAIGLTAMTEAMVGETIPVEWTGPDYDRDYISVAEVGAGTSYENYVYTSEGSPAMLVMPAEPGDYEIRYQLAQDNEVKATIPITVLPLKVSLSAPAEAVAGSTVEVTWDGPGYDRDYVSVAEAGAGTAYENYTYTSEGTPLPLVMPVAPGNYEIRYQLSQDNTVVQRIPVTVTPVTAQLTAPQGLTLSDELIVGWDGPDYERDYIAIATPGESGYIAYSYTSDGNPASLRMPDAPGEYELRYVLAQDNEVIATLPVSIGE